MIKRLRTHLQTSSLWWGQCLLCRHDCQHQPLICQQCLAELPTLAYPCPRCAFPLAIEDTHCGQCQQQLPPWQRMQVIADYIAPFPRLIYDLKYHQKSLHGRLLGQLLAQRLTPPYPDVLLPVPLHWWRQFRRGYNQAFEIAKGIQDILPIPIDHKSLRRARYTASQTHLSKRQRQQNLQQAFISKPLAYKHVALVDDVITTGSTMAELTQLLHHQGVSQVEVWAACRTLVH